VGAHVAQTGRRPDHAGPLAVTRRLNNSIVGAFLLLMTGSNDIRTPTMRL
jgi:hypothetical protein